MTRLSMVTEDSVPAVGGIADYLHGLMSASVGAVHWRLWSLVPAAEAQDQALPYPTVRVGLEPRRLGERFGDHISLVRRANTYLWRCRRRRESRKLMGRVIAEDAPDLVVIGRWCPDALGWCDACRQAGVPYAIIAHGLELVERLPRWARRGRDNDLAGAAGVFGCSSYTVQLVNKLTRGRARTHVLSPGVSADRLVPLGEAARQSVLADMGIGDRPFVLAMGRLVHRKGFDLAVEAFGLIAAEFPELDLVVAGDGPAQSEVEAARTASWCPDRVRLLGEVAHQQKLALFQRCLFYMMPNVPTPQDMEGFGIVFQEANLFGKAVIGGNNGGVPDSVAHERTGLLVDTPDIQALAAAMRRLVADPSLRERLGEQGRARVMESFLWQGLALRGFLPTLAHITGLGSRTSPAEDNG